MKPNQKNRYGGRYNNSRGTRSQTIFRNTALESTGPLGKVHGTALQLFEKYQAAAKDALMSNDLILSETCLQFADHYMRLQNIAIANEQAFRMNQTQNFSNRPKESSSTSESNTDQNKGEPLQEMVASTPQENSFLSQDIPAFLEKSETTESNTIQKEEKSRKGRERKTKQKIESSSDKPLSE